MILLFPTLFLPHLLIFSIFHFICLHVLSLFASVALLIISSCKLHSASSSSPPPSAIPPIINVLLSLSSRSIGYSPGLPLPPCSIVQSLSQTTFTPLPFHDLTICLNRSASFHLSNVNLAMPVELPSLLGICMSQISPKPSARSHRSRSTVSLSSPIMTTFPPIFLAFPV